MFYLLFYKSTITNKNKIFLSLLFGSLLYIIIHALMTFSSVEFLQIIKNNYFKVLTAMLPVIPHFSNECIKLLGITKDIQWPKIDDQSLVRDHCKYIIQINGRTRKVVDEKKNLSKVELINLIKTDTKLIKYLKEDTLIKKTIFIPNKLINIII